ncbi:MAG: homoserine O-acetyltransferase [Rhodospirillaceae bacterium]|nr:homoserine O-acetyltransferase [Rhodospirillaceae bacterium]
MRSTATLLVALAAAVLGSQADAYDQLVEKQVFEMGAYTTVGGQTIPDVRIGWEAYGTLNDAHDNVILVTHFFSGTSHAAGRYAEDDAAPGYWDAIIGPGLPLDTDRYYVISSDTLVNLNANDPMVTTTGPASINPATGEPWGMDFPIVTIEDFVHVQKALLDSLGIDRLHAVMGASMGSLQALEWAATYPEMVERVIPVIPAGQADAWLIAWLDLWGAPIMLDPNWNGGDYYGGEPPLAGLTLALELVTLQARHPIWADATFGRNWAADGADPAADFDNRYAVEAWLADAGSARAAVADANHFLYLVKANQLFVAGHDGSLEEGLAHIQAPVLLLPAASDLLLMPYMARAVRDGLMDREAPVDYLELEGTLGHIDGIAVIGQAGDAIRAFLEQ